MVGVHVGGHICDRSTVFLPVLQALGHRHDTPFEQVLTGQYLGAHIMGRARVLVTLLQITTVIVKINDLAVLHDNADAVVCCALDIISA